jgi:hypothetical protein
MVVGVLVTAMVAAPRVVQAAPEPTTTIEDSDIGTGINQVSYTGDWTVCGGCVPTTPNGRFRYSTAGGSTVRVRFSGTQIKIYGIVEPHGGIAIALDGSPATTIDTYAVTSSATLLYDSGPLTNGIHTAYLVNVQRHNPASDAYVIGFDRAEISTGNRSGQPWLSGANGDPAMTPADVDAFCTFRGSPCDLAETFVARNSWSAIVQPSFAETNFAGWPGRLKISVPPFPENAGASLATCATGAYDSYWRTFGTTLNSTGRQNSIIRIAWEANGDWYQWSATDPAAYIGCWRHIADAIRSTANPDPLLDWGINAHYPQNPPSHDARDIYPGDNWVDIVSIDAYDHHPPSPTLAAFNAQANANGGITWLYNFARAHNKLFGIGEWGVASGSDNGGGDDANYIQFMRDWMTARAGQGLYYEAYFNNCEAHNLGSNIYRPTSSTCLYRNPNAAARYASLW